jgi:chorismate mutase
VPGALPRVIRVLVHYHAADGHQPQHAYLGEARALRSDLAAAQ